MTTITVGKAANFTGHRDCVYSLEGGGGDRFFSAAGDGMVVSWNTSNPDTGYLIAQVENSIYSLHYKVDSNSLFIGHNFEGVHKIDPDAKKEVSSSSVTKSAIFDIKSTKDLLFVGTGDGVLIVLSVHDLSVIKRLKVSEKSLRTLAIDPSGTYLVGGFSDNSIRVFELDGFELVKEIPAHDNSVFTICFSPDGKYLLSGSRDAHLKVWSVENDFQLHKSVVAHMYAINHIEYNKEGSLFATCSMDKSIKIWDAQNFSLLKVIDKARHAGHGTSVNKLHWSDNGKLMSCSDDRSISVWDLNVKENK